MAGQPTLLSSPPPSEPTPPPDTTTTTTPTPPQKVGQVAGRTAADVLIVCCCCPCGLVECLVLAVCKAPATMVRRMWRKQKQRLMVKVNKGRRNKSNKGLLDQSTSGGAQRSVGYGDEVSGVEMKEFEKVKVSVDGSAVELDRKMWDRFHNAGFWRSPSQRHT